jgi:FAD/FMN-containing dehydrogenase
MLAPDVSSAVGQELIHAIGAENVSTDPAALRNYSYDDSVVTGTCPDFIAYPHNNADVREVV